MLCVIAVGTPLFGTYTKIRRDTMPRNSSTPADTGFTPRKSYRSQPSTPASAIARCSAERESVVSMVEIERPPAAAGSASGRDRDVPPVHAPLAVPFLARGAAHVVHAAAGGAEQAQHLVQRLLVVRAAERTRRALHRD